MLLSFSLVKSAIYKLSFYSAQKGKFVAGDFIGGATFIQRRFWFCVFPNCSADSAGIKVCDCSQGLLGGNLIIGIIRTSWENTFSVLKNELFYLAFKRTKCSRLSGSCSGKGDTNV